VGSETPEARFERLLIEHGPALRRLASGYAWSGGDTEDLLQEIGLAIWRALPSFRGDCSEKTFLLRIGHNRGITWRARRPPAHSSLDLIDELPDHRPTPDAEVERADRRGALLQAIRQLPTSRRQVVLLSLEGLSHDEIAEVLGTTANNVGVRLNRARADLRRLLEQRR